MASSSKQPQTVPFFSIPHLFCFLFFQRVLRYSIGCQATIYSKLLTFLQSKVDCFACKEKSCTRNRGDELSFNEGVKKVSFSAEEEHSLVEKGCGERTCEDVKVVMGRLGFEFDHGEYCEDSHGISAMFDEKEPSVAEIKETFDVFDENSDGVIDPSELQRVLCGLGFRQGLNIESCKQMIAAFDSDGDGFIDFRDFVKFMETCLDQ